MTAFIGYIFGTVHGPDDTRAVVVPVIIAAGLLALVFAMKAIRGGR